MPTIIKNQEVCADNWRMIEKDQTPVTDANVILPLTQWNNANGEKQALWLDSDETPDMISRSIDSAAFIAINFPVFSDGRGYSYARILRQHMGYKGELRAIGDVLVDQLHYLRRCGFDSFALREDQDTDTALQSLNSFSLAYQSSTDQVIPAFRQR